MHMATVPDTSPRRTATPGAELVGVVLEACGRSDGDMADSVVACLITDTVEGLLGLGRPDEAQRFVDTLDRPGGTRTWLPAICQRCRAMILAHSGQVDAALAAAREALRLHGDSVMPFERARAQLLLGLLLRRQRQKATAAAALTDALAAFEALGVESWAQRVRAELDRTGVGRSNAVLTPTEERVAELTAVGLTNREVAGRLFLSPKTVEVNLTRIYRKLALRSRAQLTAYMNGMRTGEAQAS
ncbi:helix-turn-helix transcriptional regulator [Mycobacterium sp. IDR2000157661]|uniref:helix-turn-helix transcriptional regulator n=1 Tax=Mycobacterium sp. IDR2000157661 TaxID=2867005 RepID=UPI001EE9EAB6|nr:helix-turn-helix transcriptional regulator [Mycobacterium sp. IDR2000157661]ULE31986.1 helix-turn-helix transcriptional regulator [Mycobacterium sp. IDR2000157661]